MNGTPNKPDAVNPAIASRFHVGRQWRGVTDPKRWTLTMRALFIVALALALSGCRHGAPVDADVRRVPLTFHAVSRERSEDARFIDTPDFPRYGYIHLAPDLVITQLHSAGAITINSSWQDGATGEVEKTSRPGAFFSLFANDAKKVAELKRQHLGKHNLLMMLGDTPLGECFLSESADAVDSIRIPTGLTTNYVPLRAHQEVQQIEHDLKRLVRD
jgi:hypothetical protein